MILESALWSARNWERGLRRGGGGTSENASTLCQSFVSLLDDTCMLLSSGHEYFELLTNSRYNSAKS